MKCPHHQYDIEFNITVVLVVIVLLLMAREVFGWFFKTNELIALLNRRH